MLLHYARKECYFYISLQRAAVSGRAPQASQNVSYRFRTGPLHPVCRSLGLACAHLSSTGWLKPYCSSDIGNTFLLVFLGICDPYLPMSPAKVGTERQTVLPFSPCAKSLDILQHQLLSGPAALPSTLPGSSSSSCAGLLAFCPRSQPPATLLAD